VFFTLANITEVIIYDPISTDSMNVPYMVRYVEALRSGQYLPFNIGSCYILVHLTVISRFVEVVGMTSSILAGYLVGKLIRNKLLPILFPIESSTEEKEQKIEKTKENKKRPDLNDIRGGDQISAESWNSIVEL